MTKSMQKMLEEARSDNRNRVEYRGQQCRTAQALVKLNLGRIYSDPAIRGMWFDATPGTYKRINVDVWPYVEVEYTVAEW